jgi:hypothetical protein
MLVLLHLRNHFANDSSGGRKAHNQASTSHPKRDDEVHTIHALSLDGCCRVHGSYLGKRHTYRDFSAKKLKSLKKLSRYMESTGEALGSIAQSSRLSRRRQMITLVFLKVYSSWLDLNRRVKLDFA